MGDDGRFLHVYPTRVYYEDTDSSGFVYHASYLRFAERARTEMLRDFGFSHSRLRDEEGVAFVVRDLFADFRSPARLDDLLHVETRILVQRGASMDLDQSIRGGGIDRVRIRLKLACITLGGRASRVPEAVRSVFSRLLENNSERTDGE